MNELKFNVVQSIGEITANFDEFKNQVSQELEQWNYIMRKVPQKSA